MRSKELIYLDNLQAKISSGDATEVDNQLYLLERFVDRNFPNSAYYGRLKEAKHYINYSKSNGCDSTKTTLYNAKTTTLAIIEALIEEIENFGIPIKNEMKTDKSINIHNNNNNNITQNQTLNLDTFKEVLKENLTGKQFTELEAIVAEDKTLSVAAPKILDKIKSFGGDVASNVLAGLITNPQIFSSLF